MCLQTVRKGNFIKSIDHLLSADVSGMMCLHTVRKGSFIRSVDHRQGFEDTVLVTAVPIKYEIKQKYKYSYFLKNHTR